MKIKKGAPKGFSLIEIMFTMIFLVVIVLGVMKLETGNLILSNTQNLSLQAQNWANHGLEIAESQGMAGMESCSGDCMFDDSHKPIVIPPGVTGEDVNEDGLFFRIIKVEPLGIQGGTVAVATPLASPTAFRVTSKVTWTDNTGEHFALAKRIIYE